MGKYFQWVTDAAKSTEFQTTKDDGVALYTRAKATKCESLAGKAFLSARSDKLKTRVQLFVKEFTDATQADIKDYMNKLLYLKVQEALS